MSGPESLLLSTHWLRLARFPVRLDPGRIPGRVSAPLQVEARRRQPVTGPAPRLSISRPEPSLGAVLRQVLHPGYFPT